jgi:hypothetical protein
VKRRIKRRQARRNKAGLERLPGDTDPRAKPGERLAIVFKRVRDRLGLFA